VVIFLIDTLRADRLGVYGYPHDTSPRIDALTSEAVVFEEAHSPAPWTLPSVVSLMLSAPLCEHNVLHDRQRIDDAAVPLAARLGRIGYATASFHVNPYAGRLSGLDRGFDLSRLVRRQNNGARVAKWLRTLEEGRPFFLYLHNTEPHQAFAAKDRHLEALGYDVPEAVREELGELVQQYRRLTRRDFVRRQPLGTTDNTEEQRRILERLAEHREHFSQLYDAQVRAADRKVGTVVDHLRKLGVWEETLFVVVSDHGEEMYEHGGWLHDQSAYQELVRVPLVVKFPGGVFAGERIEQPVTLLDLLPTIMDVLGRPELAEDSRGASLLPVIRGDAGGEWGGEARVTSIRHNRKKYYRPFKEARGDLNVVVVDGRWKGIYNQEVPSFELYDLESDPGERRSLADEEPARTRSMLAAARNYYQRCLDRQRAAADVEELEPEEAEALKSLGYLGN